MLSAADWGPADWYVVASGIAAIAAFVGALLVGLQDSRVWEDFKKPPAPNPKYRSEAAPRAPDAPPRPGWTRCDCKGGQLVPERTCGQCAPTQTYLGVPRGA